jgi:hypothetical protein
MKNSIRWMALSCLVFMMAQPQAADKTADKTADKKAAKKRAAPMVIESCVSSDKISYRDGDNGTLLDELDRFQVATEIVRRYPMIERDGLYPVAIALWRRTDGDWVFALLMNKPEPARPFCFTANVAVTEVELAPTLLKKYFGIPV